MTPELRERLAKAVKILAVCFAALVVIGALTSCASSEQIARQDHRTCLGLGAQPGTEAYIQCRYRVAQLREQRRANAWAAYGTTMQNYYQQQQLYQQSRPRNCYVSGSMISCY